METKKRGGLELRGRPLIPLLKSPVCLQLRDKVEVKSPRTLDVHASVLKHCMRFIFKKFLANFKIYERAYHGSKFCSLLRRVNKILKFG